MKQIKKIGLWCILLFACIQISGCGDGQTSWKSEDHEISSELTYEKSMDLDYATEFAVDYYENGFTLISISDGSRFLLNTEGEQVPLCEKIPSRNICLIYDSTHPFKEAATQLKKMIAANSFASVE